MKNTLGWFDLAVTEGAEEVQRVAKIRGVSYGDSWADPHATYLLATLWYLRKQMSVWLLKRKRPTAAVLRAVLLAAIIDIKESRLPFAFEFLEDTPDDTANYLFAWKKAMREAIL